MTATPQPPVDPVDPAARAVESIIIRPWPKVVFLYPTFFAALICFVVSWMTADPNGQAYGILGNVFFTVLCLNLMVFSFDFSRIKSITIVIALIALLLFVLWGDTKWNITGFLGGIAHSIDIRLNTQFYGFFAGFLAFVFAIVFINSRFHYYEVNAREILHHHGYLGDITRWSTEGLEMNKEIYDLAEYMLLRSGRLIFLPASSKRAVVIDNVAKVNLVEERVNDLLSVVAVRLNQRPGPG